MEYEKYPSSKWDKTLVKLSLPGEQTLSQRIVWAHLTMVTLPLSLFRVTRSFSVLHHEKPMGVLGGKSQENMGSLQNSPRSFSFSSQFHSAFSNSSQLPFKYSYQFMAQATSAIGKQVLTVTLDLPVSPDFAVVVRPVTSVF